MIFYIDVFVYLWLQKGSYHFNACVILIFFLYNPICLNFIDSGLTKRSKKNNLKSICYGHVTFLFFLLSFSFFFICFSVLVLLVCIFIRSSLVRFFVYLRKKEKHIYWKDVKVKCQFIWYKFHKLYAVSNPYILFLQQK